MSSKDDETFLEHENGKSSPQGTTAPDIKQSHDSIEKPPPIADVLASKEYLNLHEAHNILQKAQNGVTERLNAFEKRLHKVEDSDAETDSDTDSDFSDVEDDYTLGFEKNTIPEARDMPFELFKNRYNEKDGQSCIEVLVAGSNFEEQVRQELKRRGELDRNDFKPSMNYDESDERIIRRVRIQSPAIIYLLHRVLDNPHVSWKGQNRATFYRPFSWFIQAHGRMREKLDELEGYFSKIDLTDGEKNRTVAETVNSLQQSPLRPQIADTTTDTAGGNPSQGDSSHPSRQKSLARRVDLETLEVALMQTYHSLLELRCFVDFVSKRILPLFERYNDANSSEAGTVRYQDLWYLFRPGDLIYIHQPVGNNKLRDGGLPEIGRIYAKYSPDVTSSYGNYSPASCEPRKRRISPLESNSFYLTYYRLDFNGDSFGPVVYGADIPSFEGYRDVISFPAYPLQYHQDSKDLVESLRQNGQLFRDAANQKHMIYCGWTLTTVQKDSTSVDDYRHIRDPIPANIISQATYIESDVIVDVKEACRTYSPWMTNITSIRSALPEMHAYQDTVEIITWSDKQRTKKLSEIQDRTQTEEAIDRIGLRQWIDDDPFAKLQNDPTFNDDDLLLLPRRILGYALRERKFFQGDIKCLRKVQPDADSFNNLKIDESHIKILNAVVSSHFQRKQMEGLPEFSTMMDQDLIRGKGRGLVILLHGAPGVGKTATAEAVALAHEKPLFVITCGDLGFTPQGVEASLGEIFRLAHLWNCILLLDEADVFLSQRETNALERNALVSVFLRVLEYYNGILFLTTNRVGTLDEAFKSRVHLSLYYPALDIGQTEDIIRMNLRRLRVIEEQRAKATGQRASVIYEDEICNFAVQHWKRHAEKDGQGRWNGRQIRNAVNIAASLAWYERKNDKIPGTEELPPILNKTHFETVEVTMSLFEGYLTKVKGGTDSFVALQKSERYDKFQTPQASRETSHHQPLATPSSESGAGSYSPYPYRQTPQASQWSQRPAENPGEHIGHSLGPQASSSHAPEYSQMQSPHHTRHEHTMATREIHQYSNRGGQVGSTDPRAGPWSDVDRSKFAENPQLYPQNSTGTPDSHPAQLYNAGGHMGSPGQFPAQSGTRDPFMTRAHQDATNPVSRQDNPANRAQM